jgi:hypothetical protein
MSFATSSGARCHSHVRTDNDPERDFEYDDRYLEAHWNLGQQRRSNGDNEEPEYRMTDQHDFPRSGCGIVCPRRPARVGIEST